MGASILSVAAGAGEGLDEYMKRALIEEAQAQAARAHEESARHNRASEALTGRGQDITDRMRRDALAEAERNHIATLAETTNKNNQATADRQDKQVASTIQLRTKGANVLPEEEQMERAHGAPSSLYGMYSVDPKTGALPKGVAVDEGGGGPKELKDQPKRWMGTAKDKQPKAGSIRQDSKGNYIRVNEDNTTEPINDAEGNQQAGFHPPQVQFIETTGADGKVVRKAVEKKAGTEVSSAPTNTTRTMMEGAQMLRPHVTKLGELATELDKNNMFGPVMSRVRVGLTKAGTIDEFMSWLANDPQLQNDRNAGRFATSLGLMATGAGRVHGGARGGGSPQMYEHFKAMLSDASTLPMFLGRLDAIDEYMSSYAGGPAESAKEKTPAADSDDALYQQYLSRTRGKGPQP